MRSSTISPSTTSTPGLDGLSPPPQDLRISIRSVPIGLLKTALHSFVAEASNFAEYAHPEALLPGRSDTFDRSETR